MGEILEEVIILIVENIEYVYSDRGQPILKSYMSQKVDQGNAPNVLSLDLFIHKNTLLKRKEPIPNASAGLSLHNFPQ